MAVHAARPVRHRGGGRGRQQRRVRPGGRPLPGTPRGGAPRGRQPAGQRAPARPEGAGAAGPRHGQRRRRGRQPAPAVHRRSAGRSGAECGHGRQQRCHLCRCAGRPTGRGGPSCQRLHCLRGRPACWPGRACSRRATAAAAGGGSSQWRSRRLVWWHAAGGPACGGGTSCGRSCSSGPGSSGGPCRPSRPAGWAVDGRPASCGVSTSASTSSAPSRGSGRPGRLAWGPVAGACASRATPRRRRRAGHGRRAGPAAHAAAATHGRGRGTWQPHVGRTAGRHGGLQQRPGALSLPSPAPRAAPPRLGPGWSVAWAAAFAGLAGQR